jgi:hypothetical protein
VSTTRVPPFDAVVMKVIHFTCCEMWPCTLQEEHGQRVFKKRALRQIFEKERGSEMWLGKTAE